MRMRGCIKIVVNTDETDETDKTDLNTLDYQGMLKQEICENLFNPCYPCAKFHFDTPPTVGQYALFSSSLWPKPLLGKGRGGS